MKARIVRTATSALVIAVLCSPAAQAMDKTYILSLELAKKIAAGCETKAKESGWKMNIAVVDNGANDVMFERMDGAYLGSGEIARLKAQTSARFPFPTRAIEQLAYGKDLKGGMIPGLAQVPGIIAFAGGVPIMTADNAHIGGVGVSGGTADQDETCAQAGLDAVKDILR